LITSRYWTFFISSSSSRVSTKPFIAVRGVLSSWDIFGEDNVEIPSELPIAAEGRVVYKINEEGRISRLVDLAQKVFLVVERELKLTGFWESIPARNKLRAEFQSTLLAPEFSKLPGIVKNRAHIISRTMEIAYKKNDIILYAE
jgi:type I restriction enzyme R subunit